MLIRETSNDINTHGEIFKIISRALCFVRKGFKPLSRIFPNVYFKKQV